MKHWPQAQKHLTFKHLRKLLSQFPLLHDSKGNMKHWPQAQRQLTFKYSRNSCSSSCCFITAKETWNTDHKHRNNWPSSTWGTPVQVPAAPWQRRTHGGWQCPQSAAASPHSACPPSGHHWHDAEFERTLKTSRQTPNKKGKTLYRDLTRTKDKFIMAQKLML